MIPILYPVNLLAPPSVVTMSAAAGFPVRRMSDGDIGLLWKDSGTGTRDIVVDQGTGTQAVDTVLIAAGHNLAGLSMTVASGPTLGSLTDRATFTVGAGLHRQTFSAAFTSKVWFIRMTATVVAPSFAELVLSLAVPLPSSPVLRGGEVGQLANVVDLESYGGYDWGLARGAERWMATYPVLAMTLAQRDALLAAHRALDGGARHCYLTDQDGVTRWVTWQDRQVRFTAPLPDRYDVTLRFREVLGAV